MPGLAVPSVAAMNLTIIGAAAGLAGLLLVDLLNRDHPELDPVGDMASYFVHGRAGWVLVVALLCWAAATFAVLPVLRGHRVGAALVGLFGTGVAVAAVVPTQPAGNWDAPVSAATLVHGVAGWVAFVVLPVAAWLVNRRWRGLPLARARSMLMVTAAALLVLTAVGTVEVMDGPDHLGHVLGLLERAMVVADVGWLVAASVAGRAAGREPGLA